MLRMICVWIPLSCRKFVTTKSWSRSYPTASACPPQVRDPGTEHKRVHPDVAEHPAIMGHEFAGDIVKVGAKHQDKFKPGMKFTLQPALNYKGTMWSPGYSYEFFGGDATYCIIPAEVMELGCLLEYKGRAYYEASLAEPMSCSIGAFNAAYHTKMGVYHHEMGIKKGRQAGHHGRCRSDGSGCADVCAAP